MNKFSVCFEIVTQGSAKHGDADERGYISQNVSLREALKDFTSTRTNECDGGDGLECSGDWFTYYNGMEYLTGAFESRSLHPPRNITASSFNRLSRLLGC